MATLTGNVIAKLITDVFGWGATLDANGALLAVTGPTFRNGTADPSAGAGVTAALGSYYVRTLAGNVAVWLKTDVADTAWSISTLGGAVTPTSINTTATAAFQWTFADNQAAAGSFGSAGALDLLVLDTQNGVEAVRIGDYSLSLGAGNDVIFTANGTDVVLFNTAAALLLAHDDVFTFADPADVTKRARVDVGTVTAGQTRVVTVPDNDVALAGVVREVADPGNGVAIPVTTSAYVPLTIGAGAETNTLAVPTFAGQRMTISCDTVGGGTRAITAASAINVAGNTTMTFNAARDIIELVGTRVAGVLAWEVAFNSNVALS